MAWRAISSLHSFYGIAISTGLPANSASRLRFVSFLIPKNHYFYHVLWMIETPTVECLFAHFTKLLFLSFPTTHSTPRSPLSLSTHSSKSLFLPTHDRFYRAMGPRGLLTHFSKSQFLPRRGPIDRSQASVSSLILLNLNSYIASTRTVRSPSSLVSLLILPSLNSYHGRWFGFSEYVITSLYSLFKISIPTGSPPWHSAWPTARPSTHFPKSRFLRCRRVRSWSLSHQSLYSFRNQGFCSLLGDGPGRANRGPSTHFS